MSAIADVSKGMLYNHFENKAQLFRAVIQRECLSMLSMLWYTSAESCGIEDTLARLGHQIIKVLMSDQSLLTFRIVVSEAHKFPELARSFYEVGPAKLVDLITEMLK